MNFFGYERPDGSVGVRNFVLVIANPLTSLIATQICQLIHNTRTVLVPGGNFLPRTARDAETGYRTLAGLGMNPNVASVLITYDDPRLVEWIQQSGKRVEFLSPSRGGTLGALGKGIELARDMVYDASKLRRQPFDLSHLSLAVKDGGSDFTICLAGNPVAGVVFDRVVAAGGTAIFGENTEIIGSEEGLARRAVNNEVAQAILDVAHDREEAAKATGQDIREINPVPANIRGGLSTLEEKSQGSVLKAGASPIQGVLKFGERPAGKGLYFSDSDPGAQIYTGFAASGAQLLLMTTGALEFVQNFDLLLKSPGVVAPLLYSTANPRCVELSLDSVDFYCGTVLEGSDTIDSAAEKLLELIVDTASGSMTKEEVINHNDPTQFDMRDPAF